MNEIRALLMFCQVVRSGSVTRAAQHLQVTQSAVSHALTALERELGATLLVRSRSQCVLTPSGARWYEAAQQIADTVEQTRRAHAVAMPQRRVPVTLATHVTFGFRWVIPHLRTLEQRFPQLELHYRFADPMETLVDWVLTGQADVALVVRPLEARRSVNCVVRPVQEMPFVLAASPAYLRRNRPIRTIADLRTQTLLELLPEYNFYQRMLSELPRRRAPLRFGHVRYCGTVAVVVEAALQGLGLAFLPHWHLRPHLRARRLVMVLPTKARCMIAQCLVLLPGQARAPHLQPLLKYLHAELRKIE